MYCITFTKNLCTNAGNTQPCYFTFYFGMSRNVTGNIMKNSKVYCQINVQVCSCFLIILKNVLFSTTMRWSVAGGCFTEVMLHSWKTHHQEHATEPCRLPKDVVATWGGIINPLPPLMLQSALLVLFVNLLRYVIETESLFCLTWWHHLESMSARV